MRVEGKIYKEGKWWVVALPSLDLMTQGTSRKDAFRMGGAVVVDLVGKTDFRVKVIETGKDTFQIEANDSRELIALLLHRQRVKHGLSVVQASKRMGSDSPNAFGAYEQGKRAPSIEQLEKILKALDEKTELILKVG